MVRARPDIPAPGTDAAKARRAAKVNLSGLDDLQRRLREVLILTGEAGYGERWQTDMAKALNRAPQQVASWVSGKKAVPPAAYFQLGPIAHDLADELERRAAAIRAAWPPRSAFEPSAAGAPGPPAPEPQGETADPARLPLRPEEHEAYIARVLAELGEDDEPAGATRG